LRSSWLVQPAWPGYSANRTGTGGPTNGMTSEHNFLIDIFYAACVSWKSTELATPFPPNWGLGDRKDIRGVINALNDLEHHVETDEKLQTLRKWITTPAKVCLQQTSSLNVALAGSGQQVMLADKHHAPNVVFAVEQLREDTRFTQSASKFGSTLAFHGTSLENCHSILHHGLLNHTTQRAIFGHGVYLARRLDVARAFSKTGLGRNVNGKRSRLEIVFACEVVNHPESVYTEQLHKEQTVLDDPVPPGYFVVQDNDMIKVRYILVYLHDATSSDSIEVYLKVGVFLLGFLYFLSLLR